jgi:hyperosmotically inducible protein
MTKIHALAEHVMTDDKTGFGARKPLTNKSDLELDSRIEAAIKNSYNFRTCLKGDAIKISSDNGEVTLTGIVYQDHHKALAQETVAGLTEVRRVTNQISVVADQPTEQSDGWISMKVKAVLTFHKNVHATGTDVHTQQGVVTLSGNADSETQKQLTGEYAKDVEGVTEVRNNILVSKFDSPPHETLGEKVDDASITAQIKTSLLFHKSTHALATQVVTREGVVTLNGQAKSAAEKALVTKLAEDIQDVKRVNNRMTVPIP